MTFILVINHRPASIPCPAVTRIVRDGGGALQATREPIRSKHLVRRSWSKHLAPKTGK